MSRQLYRRGCATLAVTVAALIGAGAPAASAKPILMPMLKREIQQQKQIWQNHVFTPVGSLQPPAPPCPENGLLPAPFSNCGLAEFPATTLPFPGNMAYWGGHVQTNPKIYLVYWGWGEPGAFPSSQRCTPETVTEGGTTATLGCDPDGAGKYMADFVNQLGGTQWAGLQTQYYQTVKDSSGNTVNQFITNPPNQLGGIWVDDSNPISNLPSTSSSNPPGDTNTYTDLAAEAARAAAHFGVTDLANADFVIAQPPNYSDPNALSTGYCAFHDYTLPSVEGGIYDGITPNISYTNMPYALAVNSNGANVCGENAVNSGASGKLDGFSIVLGHEIEETVTDPGAEDILGSGLSTTNLGGWYDALDANENGDKCAWVGESLGLPGEPTVTPIPGALGDIKGNQGTTFAVQSLWSNQAAAGAGYCAGAGTDLPLPTG
jgi:serine protease